MRKKIFALVLPLTFLTLMAVPSGNAVVTPVEVERLKDVCFIRMRGDHHTLSFLLNYTNLSPDTQYITVDVQVFDSLGNPAGSHFMYLTVGAGNSADWSYGPWGCGYVLVFKVIASKVLALEDSVIIPPPHAHVSK